MPFDLDIQHYKTNELEAMLKLMPGYTYEDVAIRIEDFRTGVSGGEGKYTSATGGTEPNSDELFKFLNQVSARFQNELGMIGNGRSGTTDGTMSASTTRPSTTHSSVHPGYENGSIRKTDGSQTSVSRTIFIDSSNRSFDLNDRQTTTEYTIQLEEPLTNLYSMTMDSVYIPTTWYNIDSHLGNNVMQLVIGKSDGTDPTVVPIIVPNGRYNAESLTKALNHSTANAIAKLAAKLAAPDAGAGTNIPALFAYDPISNKFAINFNEQVVLNASTVYIKMVLYSTSPMIVDTTFNKPAVDETLGWLMGFRQIPMDGSAEISIFAVNGAGGETVWNNVTASCVPNFSGPQHLFVILEDYTNSHVTKGVSSTSTPIQYGMGNRKHGINNKNCISIIPVDISHTDLMMCTPISEFGMGGKGNIRIYSGPVDVERMKIQLCDEKGRLVNLNGADWAFSLTANIRT